MSDALADIQADLDTWRGAAEEVDPRTLAFLPATAQEVLAMQDAVADGAEHAGLWTRLMVAALRKSRYAIHPGAGEPFPVGATIYAHILRAHLINASTIGREELVDVAVALTFLAGGLLELDDQLHGTDSLIATAEREMGDAASFAQMMTNMFEQDNGDAPND